MEEHILICEDTLEGILTAVYTAYEKHYRPEQTAIVTSEEGNLRLFAVYDHILTDSDKSEKVIRTLKRRFGEEGFYIFCLALASTGEDKATVVYRTIARGLTLRRPFSVFARHADPEVDRIQKLKYNAWHEMHQLLGFVRFRELKNGVLFSRIHPKNNVLPFLADHFSDRFPGEHFLILDEGRDLFVVHEAGKPWFLAQGPEFKKEDVKESGEEGLYQELFRHFCHTIAIEARGNMALQRGMLPLRFRPYMTEFTNLSKESGHPEQTKDSAPECKNGTDNNST